MLSLQKTVMVSLFIPSFIMLGKKQFLKSFCKENHYRMKRKLLGGVLIDGYSIKLRTYIATQLME